MGFAGAWSGGIVSIEKLAYRPKEAAEALGISLSQVYALIRDKQLKATHPSSRLTLISRDAIREFLNAA